MKEMKKYINALCPSIILIFVVFTYSSSQQNSWHNTGGPYKGAAISLASGKDGQTYVLTATGIYRSIDCGKTWDLLPHDPRTYHSAQVSYLYLASSQEITVAGNGFIYLRTDDSLLFRSTDNGTTWSSLQLALGSSAPKRIVTSSAGDLFAVCDSMTIMRSADYGNYWTTINHQLPISHIYSLAVDSTRMIVLSADTCFYRSSDNGKNWLYSAGGGRKSITIAPNKTLFAAAINSGYSTIGPNTSVGLVLRSTDSGEHWFSCYSITTGSRETKVVPSLYALAATSGGNVFFTSVNEVYRSTNNGDTWSMLPPWNDNPNNDYPRSFCIDGTNGIYFGTKYNSILRFVDQDTLCSHLSSEFISQPVKSVVARNSGSLFATVDSGIYRSNDNGHTWQNVLSPIGYGYAILDAGCTSKGTLFAVKEEKGAASYLFRSPDSGEHWDSLGENGCILGIGPGNMLFVGYTYGLSQIFLSRNDGNSFVEVSREDTVGRLIAPVCFAFGTGGAVFAGSIFRDLGVERTLDSGKTWVGFRAGLPQGGSWMGGVQVLGVNPSGTVFAGTDSGFYRSTNNGELWVRIDQSLPKSLKGTQLPGGGSTIEPVFGLPNVSTIVFDAFGHVYIGYDRGVFYSIDNGDTWIPFIADETKNYSIKTLAFDSQGYLYGGNLDGTMYRSSAPTTSILGLPEAIPRGWKLEQNFPNPFNPTTTIQFAVPAPAFVSLKIVDVIGREIATIVSEELSAGIYARTWNAYKYSSGVYFCRLQSGSYAETKKLLLLK